VTEKHPPVAPSPALAWNHAPQNPRHNSEAASLFATYFIERSPAERARPICWWLRVQLTALGGADPLIKTFTLDHYRTLKDAKAAAEIYDVGLAAKAEERRP
jgi:hypothetical protein